jgi:GNAT superfamily N-acetyltransferase
MIEYKNNPPLENAAMQALFSSAWSYESKGNYQPILERADGYVAAFDDEKLVGFVKIITDAGLHAFLLDPSVHVDYQRRGIGLELVKRVTALARDLGCHWLHVDFEAQLEPFYQECGFMPSRAGLIRLDAQD